MCRNIKTLFNFEPPATHAEIRASAEQFVRKLSGFTHPSKANEAAFHRAIDEVRRRRDLQALPEFEDDLPATLTMGDVWSEVAERLDARSVRQAFAELPEPQQEALRLAYYEGLTQEEIASRMGTPLGTVKSRTRLGLLSLRRRLGDGDVDGDGQSERRSGTGHDTSGATAQAVE